MNDNNEQETVSRYILALANVHMNSLEEHLSILEGNEAFTSEEIGKEIGATLKVLIFSLKELASFYNVKTD